MCEMEMRREGAETGQGCASGCDGRQGCHAQDKTQHGPFARQEKRKAIMYALEQIECRARELREQLNRLGEDD